MRFRAIAGKAALGMGAALLAVTSISGTAQATPSVEGAAARAGLSCKTSAGKTGGWGECTGSGKWRARADCVSEPDDYSDWMQQSGGKHRMYVGCTFKIRATYIQQ